VDQAAETIQAAESALDVLAGLPLNYTEREILSAVRGVLSVAAAGLALAANHEHAAPPLPPASEPDTQQVTVAPNAGEVA
jgi:hypothetical protein